MIFGHKIEGHKSQFPAHYHNRGSCSLPDLDDVYILDKNVCLVQNWKRLFHNQIGYRDRSITATLWLYRIFPPASWFRKILGLLLIDMAGLPFILSCLKQDALSNKITGKVMKLVSLIAIR